MKTAIGIVEKEPFLIMGSKYFYLVELDKNCFIKNTNVVISRNETTLQNPLIGKPFSDLFFPKDFLNFQNTFLAAANKKITNFELDLRQVNDDASDFHWTHWEFTVEYKTNSGISICGIGHNILKKNEKTIEFPDFIYEHQIKNEIMEGLFEDNLIGFWIWDIKNETDILSISLRNMLGYEYASKGKKEVKWKKHIHPQDWAKTNQRLEDHFSSFGSIPFHCELRINSNLGKEIWSIAYGKVVKWDEQGKPINMVGCFFDISEKKKSEIILEKQNKFLQELTFNQSHMMRSKLANILGVLEVMDPVNHPNEILEYLNLLKEEASKLDKVLQNSIHNSSALHSNKK